MNASQPMTNTKTPTTFRKLVIAGLFSSALLLAAGCQHATTPIGEADGLSAGRGDGSADKFLVAQEAAGARRDGMMYDYYFDGEYLNTLGQKKLDLMIKSTDHVYPLVVYLDFPNNASMRARTQALTAYLKDAGLVDGQYRFEMGPNPNASSPAAENLVRYGKTEDTSGLGGTTPVDQSSSGAATAAPSH